MTSSRDKKNHPPPCMIHIDKEGGWYHKGARMIRRDFIRTFYNSLTLSDDGTYLIDWHGQRCYVDVEDTAFVVLRVTYSDGEASSPASFFLDLSDDTRESLEPETLRVGPDNVLYCTVKQGAFPARFNKPSYYTLASFIEEHNGIFYLPLNGDLFKITTP